MGLSILGANFGAATMTQAPSACRGAVLPLNLTEAVTGPSDTSSCQPSLLANVVIGALDGEDELPKPPSTSKRPFASVRISPSGTFVPMNCPLSNFATW